MTAGEKLKKLRGERPCLKVAKEIGISRSALIKYENDERKPIPDIMKKIADYYGKTVDFIFFS